MNSYLNIEVDGTQLYKAVERFEGGEWTKKVASPLRRGLEYIKDNVKNSFQVMIHTDGKPDSDGHYRYQEMLNSIRTYVDTNNYREGYVLAQRGRRPEMYSGYLLEILSKGSFITGDRYYIKDGKKHRTGVLPERDFFTPAIMTSQNHGMEIINQRMGEIINETWEGK